MVKVVWEEEDWEVEICHWLAPGQHGFSINTSTLMFPIVARGAAQISRKETCEQINTHLERDIEVEVGREVFEKAKEKMKSQFQDLMVNDASEPTVVNPESVIDKLMAGLVVTAECF